MTLNVEFIEEYPPLLVTELEPGTIYRALGPGIDSNIIIMKVRSVTNENLEYILILYSNDDNVLGLSPGLYNTSTFNTSHFVKVNSTLTIVR